MFKFKLSKTLLFTTVFVFLPFFVVGRLSAAQVTGAIFTTDSVCDGTDLNIYSDLSDVYLDGGPTHPGAAGLPDGEYYVQVTEPDGTLLGTSLGAGDETPVVVSGGEFVTCYQLEGILIKASDGTPGYDETSNAGGEYKTWIGTEPTFTNSNTKTDNFKVDSDEGEPGPDPSPSPSPVPQARLQVIKFYDANANGVNDDGQLINGWRIEIADGMSYVRYTPVDMILEPDTYTVTESDPQETNWFQTTANPVTVTLNDGDSQTVEFGNVCVGAGGGKTKGFWSNKNGQAMMNDGGTMAPELAMLSALNLRNYNGNNFDPTTYPIFRTWLTSANAVNMAYMLSAQLSAMELNVESGMVNGDALVYGDGSLGFVSVNDLMMAANDELGLHGLVLSWSPYRTYQETLKNALDDANNNLNFVQSSPCPFSFPL